MTTTTAPAETVRYIGKCLRPGCRHRVVVDLDPRTASPIVSNSRCTDCGCPMKMSRLQGVYNPAKECGGVCMGAVGPSCSCVCGGENHGVHHL